MNNTHCFPFYLLPHWTLQVKNWRSYSISGRLPKPVVMVSTCRPNPVVWIEINLCKNRQSNSRQTLNAAVAENHCCKNKTKPFDWSIVSVGHYTLQ